VSWDCLVDVIDGALIDLEYVGGIAVRVFLFQNFHNIFLMIVLCALRCSKSGKLLLGKYSLLKLFSINELSKSSNNIFYPD
jgi:hypothetical protein